MLNSHSRSRKQAETLTVSDIKRYGEGWILDCQLRQLSPRTVGTRQDTIKKLLWFFEAKDYSNCSTLELKNYLAYLTNSHKEPQGRWGIARLTKPLRPRSIWDAHNNVRCFFNWMIEEGYLEDNPMASIKPPVFRSDQIQPFTEQQVTALLNAAKKSKYPLRDTAILLFMLDTGVRASEICELCHKDLDIVEKRAWVRGKGDKHRAVYFGKATGKALWNYTHGEGREEADSVFLTERSHSFRPNSLLQFFMRMGESAKIEATRCSPHTMRHTFAVTFLRNGGNVFSLQQLLGHTELKMTQRYVALAQADVEKQHRMFSPADFLDGVRKKFGD